MELVNLYGEEENKKYYSNTTMEKLLENQKMEKQIVQIIPYYSPPTHFIPAIYKEVSIFYANKQTLLTIMGNQNCNQEAGQLALPLLKVTKHTSNPSSQRDSTYRP